ncbi:hypothetical protein N7509_009892 [Penicillium cosmopolitanum]|uniref:Carboxymuconolactone decarboxylase-like domain-containing protein n=1 Tax=Penicillium cosmopolitanum TaxID=1131564 RepID=A0A9X0B437_9EURO|nr:uncharacterized protein N7509_009892 [Penicillium cosmopolitanum]KAJ5387351.1 hypothetical protein N7509_009892 [Penicillium cosmopolitanum]
MAQLPYPDYNTPHAAATSHPTINILKLLSYSTATAHHWTELGHAQFKNLKLSNRDRELVILLTSSKFNPVYEWAHRLPLSLKAGDENFEDEKVGFSDKDLVLLTFVETIIQQSEVGDQLWERVRSEFSHREIMEIISLQGFSYTFSRLNTVLQSDFDEWAKSKL